MHQQDASTECLRGGKTIQQRRPLTAGGGVVAGGGGGGGVIPYTSGGSGCVFVKKMGKIIE